MVVLTVELTKQKAVVSLVAFSGQNRATLKPLCLTALPGFPTNDRDSPMTASLSRLLSSSVVTPRNMPVSKWRRRNA